MGLVSVIIPVYKVEQFLDKCVESVINQTYSELEIILVDDGSLIVVQLYVMIGEKRFSYQSFT